MKKELPTMKQIREWCELRGYIVWRDNLRQYGGWNYSFSNRGGVDDITRVKTQRMIDFKAICAGLMDADNAKR